MKTNSSLGKNELDTLRFVSENAPITVGEVVKGYGTPRGLARTTVLTVMDRLLAKGFLTRRRVAGVYKYSPRIEHGALLTRLVDDFVKGSLGGSLTPFVAYLADTRGASQEEIEELRRMVESLEAKSEGRHD